MKKLTLLAFIFIYFNINAQEHILSGYIIDKLTNEPVINAGIADSLTGTGTFSNDQGFFSVRLSAGNHKIVIKCIGYKEYLENITVTNNLTKNFLIEGIEIDAVEVTGSSVQITQNQTGSIELTMKDIKLLPVGGFQTDIIKSLQIMPGVSSGTEGMSALIVRGGSFDQNMVMIDGIPLFHFNHLE